MYDLPTEAELGKIITEAQKKDAAKPGDLEADTFFQFWKPKGPQSAVKLGDKTGVVKPKVDFNPGDVAFLSSVYKSEGNSSPPMTIAFSARK